MTALQTIKVTRRRWYSVIAGLTCTIAALSVLGAGERVYFAQTDAIFEVPSAPTISGVDSGFSESLTYFAAVVERAVVERSETVRLSSPTATLYGIGVHRGKSVVLADRGGQWVHNFDRPVISIQVVDSSPERVAAVMASAISDIVTTAESMQAASGAPANTRITVATVPDRPQIISFGQSLAGKAKGVGAMAFLGLGFTTALACLADRYALLRLRRHPDHELIGS